MKQSKFQFFKDNPVNTPVDAACTRSQVLPAQDRAIARNKTESLQRTTFTLNPDLAKSVTC